MNSHLDPAPQIADARLLQHLDSVARAYLVARYSGPGNPMQAEYLRRGTLIATKVPFVPGNALMNRATGLASADDLVEVRAFYAATGQHCWIESTTCTPATVTDALIRARFRIVGSGATLYAAPLPVGAAEPPSGISIRSIDADDITAFLDTINLGFGSSAETLPALRRNQQFWLDMPDWHLYLACCDGVPAGAAVLSNHGTTAYLAAAATLPEFRRRGVQRALIDARLEVARGLGAKLVTGQAEWGGSSQANMQRAGLQISHLRTHWTNAP